MKSPLYGALLCLACNAPAPPPSTGGVDVEGGPCGRGLVVVSSDYQSTNVSVLDNEGNVLSASILSSASESTALSAPLSGDVVTPTARASGDELVLIDRYPASVLTWLSLTSGDVRAQLDVSTGFAANPRDYVELADGRAYVSRFESNPEAGKTSYDGGGDLLILDPVVPRIVGRIDLTAAMQDAPGFLPRASRMLRSGDAVYVLLLGYDADFSSAAASRLVRIDARTDTIDHVLVLDDLFGCEGLASAPDGERLAISCSGRLTGGVTSSPVGSGLVVIAGDGSAITSVYPAEQLLGQPLGFSAAFTRQGGLLVTALGAFSNDGGPDVLDAVLHVAPDGTFDTVFRSSSRPFELGEVRCAVGAGGECGHCFMTDAETGGLHRLDPDSGALEVSLPLDDGIGLPPRVLGRF